MPKGHQYSRAWPVPPILAVMHDKALLSAAEQSTNIKIWSTHSDDGQEMKVMLMREVENWILSGRGDVFLTEDQGVFKFDFRVGARTRHGLRLGDPVRVLTPGRKRKARGTVSAILSLPNGMLLYETVIPNTSFSLGIWRISELEPVTDFECVYCGDRKFSSSKLCHHIKTSHSALTTS